MEHRKSKKAVKPDGLALTVLLLEEIIDRLIDISDALKKQHKGKKTGFIHPDDESL